MGVKAGMLSVRIAPSYLNLLEAVASKEATTVSEVARKALELGLRIQTRDPEDLQGVVMALYPGWNGQKPKLSAPLAIRLEDGRNPVDALLAQRGRERK